MPGKSISFETGVVEYDINGMAKAKFNPADANFVDRFYETMSDLDSEQDELKEGVDEAGEDPAAMFEYLSAKDKAMRGRIDGLLGEGVADALFPDMNCYAMADGMPAWLNLMLAIADEVDSAIDDQRKLADPRAKALDDKYKGLMDKYRPNRAARRAKR